MGTSRCCGAALLPAVHLSGLVGGGPEVAAPHAGGGWAAKDHRVQSRVDGVVNAMVLTVVPLWFYIAVHWTALFRWEHFWSILILGAGPWCLLAMVEGAPPPRPSSRLVRS